MPATSMTPAPAKIKGRWRDMFLRGCLGSMRIPSNRHRRRLPLNITSGEGSGDKRLRCDSGSAERALRAPGTRGRLLGGSFEREALAAGLVADRPAQRIVEAGRLGQLMLFAAGD